LGSRLWCSADAAGSTEQFNELSKDPDESVTRYITRCAELRSELLMVDSPFEEEDFMDGVMEGLPSEYYVVVTGLYP
jgi:hypothetical protein